MKKYAFFISILSLFGFNGFGQNHEISLGYSQSNTFRMTNDSVDFFYSNENGELRKPKIRGVNFEYGRALYKPIGLYLTLGLDIYNQIYQMETTHFFYQTKSLLEVNRLNMNVSLGISKRFYWADSSLQFFTGIKLGMRSFGVDNGVISDGYKDSLDIRDGQLTQKINLYNEFSNGQIVVNVNLGLRYSFSKRMFVQSYFQFEPKQKISYSTETTSWARNLNGDLFSKYEKLGPVVSTFHYFTYGFSFGFRF